MTATAIEEKATTSEAKRSPMKWISIGLGAVVVAAVAMIALSGNDFVGERTAMLQQGTDDSVLQPDGVTLVRADDSLRITAVMPTPPPNSYEYPTADMVPPWSDPHPEVSPGNDTEPEAFTMWVIIFNYPELCTDSACDADDLRADAAAKGGVFLGDARIGNSAELDFVGSVRVGQVPPTGSPLENPHGAELHVAIAPHGKALTGTDLWRQLNGPVGSPALWWIAEFPLG